MLPPASGQPPPARPHALSPRIPCFGSPTGTSGLLSPLVPWPRLGTRRWPTISFFVKELSSGSLDYRDRFNTSHTLTRFTLLSSHTKMADTGALVTCSDGEPEHSRGSGRQVRQSNPPLRSRSPSDSSLENGSCSPKHRLSAEVLSLSALSERQGTCVPWNNP